MVREPGGIRMRTHRSNHLPAGLFALFSGATAPETDPVERGVGGAPASPPLISSSMPVKDG